MPVPEGISTEQAAAAILQGLTAHYLTHDSYPVRAGDTVLVHAAAGGMGRLLTRIVTHLGGRVVATAGSDEKREIARADGAVRAVAYSDALAAVSEVSDGVAAVYDGVGKDAFRHQPGGAAAAGHVGAVRRGERGRCRRSIRCG